MDRSPANQTFVRDLGVLFHAGVMGALSDRELLGRFVSQAGESGERAFEAIVRRHGPMVLGVCHRVLHDAQLAEDSFQATFLVLAIKAGSIRRPDSLGPWLHGVATRIARQAREDRPWKEEPITLSTDLAKGADEPHQSDLIDALDDEIERLPGAYRRPVVLCYLEGKTQEEAARILGWSKGTVSGRLARAKDLLRTRLIRRGLAPSVGIRIAALDENTASAAVPASLANATAHMAKGVALGRVETVAASEMVRTLVHGALRAMAVSGKIKAVSAAVLVVTLLSTGVAWTGSGPSGEDVSPRTNTIPVPTTRKVLPVSKSSTAEPREAPLPNGARLRLGTTRLRHGGHVGTVNFAPDGKTLLTAAEDGTVRLWDTSTGVSVMGQHALSRLSWANVATYSPDGSRIAISGDDGIIQVWNSALDRRILEVKTSHRRARGVAFSPDGKTLTASFEGVPAIKLWDVTTGREEATLKTGLVSGEISCRGVAFSPDGKRVALAAVVIKEHNSETIWIWDVHRGGNPVKIQTGHEHWTSDFTFVPGRDEIISSGFRDQVLKKGEKGDIEDVAGGPGIRVWDSKSGQHIRDLEHDAIMSWVQGLAVSRDGRTLVASHAADLVLWDLTKDQVRLRIPTARTYSMGFPGGVSISADGKTLAVARGDHAVHLWDLTSGQEILAKSDFETTAVNASACSPKGDLYATGGDEGAIHLWDSATGKHRERLDMGEQGRIYRLVFTDDGKSLIASSEYFKAGEPDFWGVVRIWDIPSMKLRRDIRVSNRAVDVALSPDGRQLAVATWLGDPVQWEGKPDENMIHLIEAETGKTIRRLLGHSKRIHSLAFSADGKSLGSASHDETFRLWDLESGRETRKILLAGHVSITKESKGQPVEARIQSAVITGDMKIAVTSASSDDRLVVWDLQRGVPRHTIRKMKSLGSLLAVSPDGRRFATAPVSYYPIPNVDQTVRIWNVDDGNELARFDPQGSRVRYMAFSHDGASLVTGMSDTTTLVWDLPPAVRSDGAK